MFFLGCTLLGAHPKTFMEHTINGYAQGTTYNIKYYSDQEVRQGEVDSLLNIIDLSMSIYNKASLISTFNNPSTGKVRMDNHMRHVIDESFRTYNLTKGYFDITVMPLVNLWGFGSEGPKNKPTESELNFAKSLVGMSNLKRKGPFLIKKKKGISIDVNGIAQGYSVDVLSDFFQSKGIENYIIEIGGEIYAKGTKPNGPFLVEVQRPYQSHGLHSYKIQLRDKAVTTSGTYEKQVKFDNKYVSHHIDPKTGFPIESKTLSVTVIANTAMEADAIDNYLIFLSPEEAVNYVEKQKDMEVYIVYAENNVFKELQSSGFNNYIYK